MQASAFSWAADRGVRVVSMSWLQPYPMEDDLIQAITSHPNVLFVAIVSGNGEPGCNADGNQGDGKVHVDAAIVTQNDIAATNGNIFELDRVLAPR